MLLLSNRAGEQCFPLLRVAVFRGEEELASTLRPQVYLLQGFAG